MAACLFVMLLMHRWHRERLAITFVTLNTGSIIRFKITNHYQKDKRLLVANLLLGTDDGIERADKVYKRVRFDSFPHVMPGESSIEISFLYSINAFIDYNQLPEKFRNNRVNKLWLRVELEDGTRIDGQKYRIPNPKWRRDLIPDEETKKFSKGIAAELHESPKLNILEARYGAEMSWIDVTENVRNQVRSNAGRVWAKTGILGVKDPIFGMGKQLSIKFRTGDEEKQVSVNENESIDLFGPKS